MRSGREVCFGLQARATASRDGTVVDWENTRYGLRRIPKSRLAEACESRIRLKTYIQHLTVHGRPPKYVKSSVKQWQWIANGSQRRWAALGLIGGLSTDYFFLKHNNRIICPELEGNLNQRMARLQARLENNPQLSPKIIIAPGRNRVKIVCT